MKRIAFPLLLSLSVATLVGGPAGAQSPTPDTAGAPLAEAVTFAPPGASAILFTDWAATKAAHGYQDVTSRSPLEQRMDAMSDLGRTEALFARFAIDRFATHADAWGWDTTDLAWEAFYLLDGPPVAVLRLRDGFDVTPVIDHFDERSFSTEVYGDATIRSHAMDISADWITDSAFGILNTAILDDGRTFVLSSGLDGVKAALDARHVNSFRAPPARVVADHLGSPLSAAIDVGPGACAAYDPRTDPSGSTINDVLLAEVGPLQAWEALGVGTYRDQAGTAVGRYTFEYPTVAAALTDQAGRARLADAGFSTRAQRPLLETVFRLVTFGVEDSAVTLDVAPLDDTSRRLQQAFFSRDMVFATCG